MKDDSSHTISLNHDDAWFMIGLITTPNRSLHPKSNHEEAQKHETMAIFLRKKP